MFTSLDADGYLVVLGSSSSHPSRSSYMHETRIKLAVFEETATDFSVVVEEGVQREWLMHEFLVEHIGISGHKWTHVISGGNYTKNKGNQAEDGSSYSSDRR